MSHRPDGRPHRTRNRRTRMAAGGMALGLALTAAWTLPASASESGASVYLLGSGGPEAAVLPPMEGVFFSNTLYYYDGKAGGDKQFLVGGNLVAGLKARVVADFATMLWTPTTNFAGATLALGGVVPIGGPDIDVSAVITGPHGNQYPISRSDDAFVVGDPLATGVLSWKHGKFSVAASTLINIPIGTYREDELANLAFHRWAGDLSLAGTWHDPKSGWDLSSKAGFTFNGENDHTDYDTGTEFHLEGSVEKQFNPAFAAGIQAYYFKQVTGDSGSGAKLGPFKGEVTGVGGHATYNFKVGIVPVTMRLHAIKEFDATNRLEGSAVWLDLVAPLWVNMASMQAAAGH